MEKTKKAKSPKAPQPAWLNADGIKVPYSAISPYDRRKEPKVKQMLLRKQRLQKMTEETNQYIIDTCDALIREKWGNQQKEFSKLKGYTIESYDKTIRIVATVGSETKFSSDVEIARELFFEFLELKLKDVIDGDLQVIISYAFSTNEGKLDKDRLLSLLKYPITHPKWRQACTVLESSIERERKGRYFKVYLKNEEGRYEAISV